MILDETPLSILRARLRSLSLHVSVLQAPRCQTVLSPPRPLSSDKLAYCMYSPALVSDADLCSSNTVPTDVINFSQSLQVRDPVRVLVRREGGNNSQESVSSITPGINLKHTYVYLTITGSALSDASAPAENGPGTIGSGRVNGQRSEESSRAKEYKLDMLVKMLDDYPLWQAVIHVASTAMLEAVLVSLLFQM